MPSVLSGAERFYLSLRLRDYLTWAGAATAGSHYDVGRSKQGVSDRESDHNAKQDRAEQSEYGKDHSSVKVS